MTFERHTSSLGELQGSASPAVKVFSQPCNCGAAQAAAPQTITLHPSGSALRAGGAASSCADLSDKCLHYTSSLFSWTSSHFLPFFLLPLPSPHLIKPICTPSSLVSVFKKEKKNNQTH